MWFFRAFESQFNELLTGIHKPLKIIEKEKYHWPSTRILYYYIILEFNHGRKLSEMNRQQLVVL